MPCSLSTINKSRSEVRLGDVFHDSPPAIEVVLELSDTAVDRYARLQGCGDFIASGQPRGEGCFHGRDADSDGIDKTLGGGQLREGSVFFLPNLGYRAKDSDSGSRV